MNARRTSLLDDYRMFSSRRRRWLREHKGKVVVVRHRKVLGFYNDYQEGLRAGLKAFGADNQFLVQKIYADGEAVL